LSLALNPKDRFLTIFIKSSAKPISPCPRVTINRVIISAFAGTKIKRDITMPKRNIAPPIVGVPALLKCALGPSERMVWPNFSFLKTGINNGPDNKVMNNEVTKTNHKSLVLIMFLRLYKFFGYYLHLHSSGPFN